MMPRHGSESDRSVLSRTSPKPFDESALLDAIRGPSGQTTVDNKGQMTASRRH